ncbi:hypothetical protein QQF64_000566 [Cirrhinus molitorella]|uniref:Uncharacterized protein n=1 Tax=Cirrhinus molitorella TaxID=172907 RepID=A0ABR3NXJ8_9TELE
MCNKRSPLPLSLLVARKKPNGLQDDSAETADVSHNVTSLAPSEHGHSRGNPNISEVFRRKRPKCNYRPCSSWLPYVLVCTVTLCAETDSPLL